MRYLVVPSQETETWKEYLVSKGWMERTLSIEIEGSGRAIPLSNLFPNKAPIDLSKFDIIGLGKTSDDFFGCKKFCFLKSLTVSSTSRPKNLA